MATSAKEIGTPAATVTVPPQTGAAETDGPMPLQPGDIPKHWTEYAWVRIGIPLCVGIAFLAAWEFLVHSLGIREFVLPRPSVIVASLFDNFSSLLEAAWFTFRVTISAFVAALISGIALSILFTQNRLVEMAFFPYAVVLQVTPVVSIAPIILIWVGLDNIELALLILAWIVAFFPILSNTTIGLTSSDHNLRNLFELYGASRWQVFRHLQFPTALPYILGGMKISGGLALIGAVVAEFVAGSGGSTGLAWRIIESGNRLNIPGMFAALILLSAMGIVIFFCMTALQHFALRKWHESAVRREN